MRTLRPQALGRSVLFAAVSDGITGVCYSVCIGEQIHGWPRSLRPLACQQFWRASVILPLGLCFCPPQRSPVPVCLSTSSHAVSCTAAAVQMRLLAYCYGLTPQKRY